MQNPTGYEINQQLRVRLSENRATTPSLQQQLYTFGWHVQKAADEVAQLRYTFYRRVHVDLIAGVAQYAVPDSLPEIRRARLPWPGAWNNVLTVITPEQADKVCPLWNNPQYVQCGFPVYAIIQERSSITLWPAPQQNIQNGLRLEGPVLCSEIWNDIATPCPLPPDFMEVVMLGAMMRRCEEMFRSDPTYAAVSERTEKAYVTQMQRLYGAMVRKSQANRAGGPPQTGVAGGNGWFGTWGVN